MPPPPEEGEADDNSYPEIKQGKPINDGKKKKKKSRKVRKSLGIIFFMNWYKFAFKRHEKKDILEYLTAKIMENLSTN